MEKIIVRENVMRRGHIGSEFIRMSSGMNYDLIEDFIKAFGINKIMKEIFCEEILSEHLKDSSLYKAYVLAEESQKDNDFFNIMYKINDEFAVHLTGNIYLYHLVKENFYASIFPWVYSDDKQYLGDTWYFQDDEIIDDLKNLSIIDFLSKYR